MLEEQNKDIADQFYFNGLNQLSQNRIVEAKLNFQKAIKMHKEHHQAYNSLGWVYETKHQDYKKAEECYAKAIEYAPEYPAGYVNYSRLLLILNRFDELEKILEKAIEIPGINKSRINNEYAVMDENRGEFAKAIEYYKKALDYSFDMQEINKFKEAIKRCEIKQQ